MNNHSAEQALAINIVGKNVVVSASAGAGKTTVLIDRLMKRVQKDGVSIDEIVAMTFTEAAALEMKHRLSMKLNATYNATKDPFLYEQITKLPGSQISTIHSFCLKLIRDYSFVLDLDPKRAQTILDEGTTSLYKKEAMKSVFDRAYANPPLGFLELLDHFSSRPEDDEGVKSAIYALSTVMRSKGSPIDWLNESIDAYNTKQSLHNLNPTIKEYFFRYYLFATEDLLVILQEMESQLTPGGKKEEEFRQAFSAMSNLLKGILAEIATMEYGRIRRLFIHAGGNIPKSNPNDVNYNKARGKFVAKYKKTIAQLFPEALLLSDLNELHGRLRCLGDLTNAFQDAFAQKKKEMNCIDFDDMEHFALDILRDTKFNVADIYRNRFKEILVDEFQDSNDVQNELVDLISNGKNVFRVGDIKQSIYRFRNAKPQLMQGLIDNQDPIKDEVIYLKNNYRSTETIVEFNNFIFDKAMNLRGLQSSYKSHDKVSKGTQSQSGGAPVEFHWVISDPDLVVPENLVDAVNPEPDYREPESIPIDEFEENGQDPEDEAAVTDKNIEVVDEKIAESLSKARHIASDILARRNSDQTSRWRDFVVLVRSHRLKTFLKEAFDEVNIPSFIDVQSGFFQANSVQDMLLMMHLCLNPEEEMHLVGVLISPFFAFSQNDIARIRLSKQGNESFKDAFIRLHRDVSQLLLEIEQRSLTMQLRDFVPYLFSLNRYYEKSCDHQQRSNLDLFLEKALLFDAKNGNLARFVDFIEEVKDAKSSEAIPISDDVDVVRVMTIHQAKGLQFPVVYFWSNQSHCVLDLISGMIVDPELGIALKSIVFPDRYARKNPIRIAVETKAIQEEMAEEMRILYVALTRPQKKLIIVDTTERLKITTLSRTSVFSLIGYSGWLKSIIKEVSNDLYIQQLVDDKVSPLRGSLIEPVSTEFIPPQRASLEYSVLTPSSQERTFAPDFTLRYRDVLDGKERGTRLHRLIEKLPLQDWSSDVILRIDPACTSDEIDSLINFYTSSFYQSAKNVKIEKEFPFAILKDSTVITGVIDMLAIYPDRIEMVDFKTDRSGNADELRLRYEGQIALYRKSLSLAFPDKEIRTFIYSFELNELLEVNPK
jgi:ATP-dependent helicase/nuclease subunit A